MFSRVLERMSKEGGPAQVNQALTTNILLHDLNKRVQLQNEMLYQVLRTKAMDVPDAHYGNRAIADSIMADFNVRLGD